MSRQITFCPAPGSVVMTQGGDKYTYLFKMRGSHYGTPFLLLPLNHSVTTSVTIEKIPDDFYTVDSSKNPGWKYVSTPK